MQDLRSEMKETRVMIKQYNGLREEVQQAKSKMDKVNNQVHQKMNSVETEIEKIKAEGTGKAKTKDAVIKWGGWIIGVVNLVAYLARHFI